MRFFYLVLFSAVLFLSCKNRDIDHLSRQKMQLILADMHDAENYSVLVKVDTIKVNGQYHLPRKNMDSLAHYYREIFAHYNTSMAEFDKSIKWYSAHPDDLDSVYADLVTTYTKLEKK